MKKIITSLIKTLEHNPEHYIKLKMFGETLKPCARCFGQYVIGVPFYFLFAFLYFAGYTFDFTLIFSLSWILALSTIMDWASVEIFHLRKGHNTSRLITGGMLGIGISMYFWLLPTTWFMRISTLLVYAFLFTLLTFSVRCKKHNINPLDEIRNMKRNIWDTKDSIWDLLTNPSKIYCCNCCGPGCCCCPCGAGSSGCMAPLCLVSCLCCPCLCCPLIGGSGCGSCGSCGSCGCGNLCGGQKKN